MLKIAIINYRIGNLMNVQRGFEKVGVKAEITDDRNKINEADAIVLSGVGAFKDAMINLKPIMEIIIDLVN